MGGRRDDLAEEAYAAVRRGRAAWMRMPADARSSAGGAGVRDALRDAGDALARMVRDGRADDGLTREDRREAADEAARDADLA